MESFEKLKKQKDELVAKGQELIDIRSLLEILQAHQENTDEWLEPDDASMVMQIAERYRIALGPRHGVR